MARFRNKTDAAVEVYLNGHARGGAMGTVQPDGILEVDDEVAKAHVWPETTWSDASVAKRETDDSGKATK